MPARNPGEGFTATGLQRLFERITDHLRRGGRRGADFNDIIPVQVDLVGGPSREPANAERNPFLAPAPDAGAPPSTSTALVRDWSFRETVLLRPSNRGSRVLLYTTLGLAGAGLVWLVVAPLNQTVLVQGKLEPNTRVKQVQTPVPGVVDQVLVQEGEVVKAGAVLLRFDLRDTRNQLAAAETIKRQLEEENATYASALGDPSALNRITPNQRERLIGQRDDLLNQREAARQALQGAIARVNGLRISIANSQNIADRYERLVRNGAASEVQLLQARNEEQQLRTNLAESEREVLKLQAELRRTRSGPNSDLRGRIEANRRLIAEQEARISTARQQLRYGELHAPTSGTVFDLDARRGTVAQAGQSLLRIVPGEALQARVYIPSNVIGFIRTGQLADLSLDTFPAADYGRLPAVVQRVSTDALTPEKQKEALGSEAAGLHYTAILSLKRQAIQAGSKTIPLQPGMTLTADIELRQRRMINLVTGFFDDKLRSLERIR